MNAPAISVLMTAYNRERFIAEAIESVLSSSFADFELVVVDDASRDRTAEIAR
jgi:glycosyltransferase involved in cell wall biosynthesis